MTPAIAERLRIYPLIILAVSSAVILVNAALGQGFMGRLGQFVTIDFLIFYSGGVLYRSDLEHLYDYPSQIAIQQQLVAPVPLEATGPFAHPPWVAPLFAAFTVLPPMAAVIVWTLITLALVIAGTALLDRRLAGPGFGRLLVLVFASAPFLTGIQAGQAFGIVFLLACGAVVAAVEDRRLLLGLCVGAMMIKPQYALGFLIVLGARLEVTALAGAAIAGALWLAPFLVHRGPQALVDSLHRYSDVTKLYVLLPYMDGFPWFIHATPYAFVARVIPRGFAEQGYTFAQVSGVVVTLAFAALAAMSRRHRLADRPDLLLLAVLYPFLATPYAMLYDLVVLAPALLLLRRQGMPEEALVRVAVAVWCLAFVAPMLSGVTGLALTVAVPLVVLGAQVSVWRDQWRSQT